MALATETKRRKKLDISQVEATIYRNRQALDEKCNMMRRELDELEYLLREKDKSLYILQLYKKKLEG